MTKFKDHRPYHLYEGRFYFITGRFLKDCSLQMDDRKKRIFQSVLARVSRELRVGILAWVVLDNHYHMICDFGIYGALEGHEPMGAVSHAGSPGELTFATPPGPLTGERASAAGFDKRRSLLSRFVRRIHSNTTRLFNVIDKNPGRRLWYQYWDYCIRNIPDYWKHFNYIVQNPFKHGLASSLYDAYRYPHSSNSVWFARLGAFGLWESFVIYPVKEWEPSGSV